jgi:hypothetical protein
MCTSVVANAVGPTVATRFGGSHSGGRPVLDGGIGGEGVLETLVVHFPVAVGFEEVRHEVLHCFFGLWFVLPIGDCFRKDSATLELL